ncbi:starvation-inducible DNA-binding protein [Paenibacillus sp. V4I3]|uniref:Dps family protein n=1 Tax=unclassified Paenibacillus TaxID=185978 RepID=UPI002784C2F7|nr:MULTISPECIES: Dps family protein [unclassified Paenibacillus]MDQ0877610.1 starvation-inducible DNA-binding protein [Paenibacillus sp. V4I3]MDQ0886517.1 starvation-inducible DNA-binding protein [Paenibacillus sp. V4I9]
MSTTTVTLQEVLNKQIANLNVLYTKLHNFHWYVKGHQFFTLHLKFEELYNEVALHFDDLAERVLAIKGKPMARMVDYLNHSSVKEAAGTENADQMVKTIAHDFEIMIVELREGMALAESLKDETTADMLLVIHTSLEKHVWMLHSFLE